MISRDNTIYEQNLGIIEVSNKDYGKEYCLFMIKKESQSTGNVMEWAVKPFYLGCVFWLCDESSFKEEKSRSITDLCGHLRI